MICFPGSEGGEEEGNVDGMLKLVFYVSNPRPQSV